MEHIAANGALDAVCIQIKKITLGIQILPGIAAGHFLIPVFFRQYRVHDRQDVAQVFPFPLRHNLPRSVSIPQHLPDQSGQAIEPGMNG